PGPEVITPAYWHSHSRPSPEHRLQHAKWRRARISWTRGHDFVSLWSRVLAPTRSSRLFRATSRESSRRALAAREPARRVSRRTSCRTVHERRRARRRRAPTTRGIAGLRGFGCVSRGAEIVREDEVGWRGCHATLTGARRPECPSGLLRHWSSRSPPARRRSRISK